VSVETSCLCDFPIIVGKLLEDAFWAWKVALGFIGVYLMGFVS